jgi:hypothetical protein
MMELRAMPPNPVAASRSACRLERNRFMVVLRWSERVQKIVGAEHRLHKQA